MKAVAIAVLCLVVGVGAGRWWGARETPAEKDPPPIPTGWVTCKEFGHRLEFAGKMPDAPLWYLKGAASVAGVAASCFELDSTEQKRYRDALLAVTAAKEADTDKQALAERALLVEAAKLLREKSEPDPVNGGRR